MNKIESGELILPRVKLAPNNNNVLSHTLNVEPILEKPQRKSPENLINTARKTYNSGITRDVNYREKQLKGLLKFLEERCADIEVALYEDIRKPKQETNMGEIWPVANDLRQTIFEFKRWAKPAKQQKRLINLLDDVKVHQDPYGVVLIVGAWNYPILLTLGPLIGKYFLSFYLLQTKYLKYFIKL